MKSQFKPFYGGGMGVPVLEKEKFYVYKKHRDRTDGRWEESGLDTLPRTSGSSEIYVSCCHVQNRTLYPGSSTPGTDNNLRKLNPKIC